MTGKFCFNQFCTKFAFVQWQGGEENSKCYNEISKMLHVLSPYLRRKYEKVQNVFKLILYKPFVFPNFVESMATACQRLSVQQSSKKLM